MTNLHFQVKQLRSQNMVTLMASLTLFVASLFTIALLPTLLIRYYYANQNLLAQPPLLDSIPLIGFVVAKVFFLYAVVMVIKREMKARKLEVQAMNDDCDCNCGHYHHDDMDVTDEEMAELESIVEKAMSAKKSSKKAKSSSKKK
jgi:hypothetical protein